VLLRWRGVLKGENLLFHEVYLLQMRPHLDLPSKSKFDGISIKNRPLYRLSISLGDVDVILREYNTREDFVVGMIVE